SPVERVDVADPDRQLFAVGRKSLADLVRVEPPHARASPKIRTRIRPDGRYRRLLCPGRRQRLGRAQVCRRVKRNEQIAFTVERNRTVHTIEAWMRRGHAVDDQFWIARGYQLTAAEGKAVHP